MREDRIVDLEQLDVNPEMGLAVLTLPKVVGHKRGKSFIKFVVLPSFLWRFYRISHTALPSLQYASLT